MGAQWGRSFALDCRRRADFFLDEPVALIQSARVNPMATSLVTQLSGHRGSEAGSKCGYGIMPAFDQENRM